MNVKNLLSILLCQVLWLSACSSDEFVNPASDGGSTPESAALTSGWVQLNCGDASGNVFVYGVGPAGCSANVSVSGKTLQVNNLKGEVIIGPFYARTSSATEWWRMDGIDLGGGIVNCRITFDPTKNQNDYIMGNGRQGTKMKFYINIQQGMTRSFKMKLYYDSTPSIADEFTVQVNAG